MVNYKSYLGFLGFLGFSISLFILIIYKGNRFGVGDHFQVLRVSEGIGVGDHFQVLRVSEGTY